MSSIQASKVDVRVVRTFTLPGESETIISIASRSWKTIEQFTDAVRKMVGSRMADTKVATDVQGYFADIYQDEGHWRTLLNDMPKTYTLDDLQVEDHNEGSNPHAMGGGTYFRASEGLTAPDPEPPLQ